MDSPKKLNPTGTLESSQTPHEECSANTQAVSEVLAKDLGKLTLNPSTKFPPLLPESSPKQQDKGKSLQGLGLGLSQGLLYSRRRGVRTLATARRERMQRMLQVIRYRTLSLLQKDPQERKLEIESRSRRFRCSCRYCLYHGDPSDNITMENNYDMESV
ncbi:developmental pluripotency-associated protein 3 [Pteronotus mesoamericanus]|uniref:developmental pluripotency-associated protein 3 n=1 Tax=Pteronotus mesoamericanus TaxID=1884717 RepID=UPI0023ECA5A7|nr:developmental pluripotency-associated protein 3 [Pteronotus parnellii mesoamericanus]